MSFFTYYGKLKDDLFVVILPNGTVEIDDPVHVYSEKKFRSYRTRDVTVTEDGEDRITFHDGFFSFEAVTSKAYKSANLTRKKISGGETVKVELTRQYDQPQTTTITAASTPKVWNGVFKFHKWATDEAFVIVAPKGLGDKKPIVALWQWTKDDKGVAKSLYCGTSEQVSDVSGPEKFSFKQNGYYDVTCQVNNTTQGLGVTIKDAKNPQEPQKELALSSLTDLGSEHRFAPPPGEQKKISIDCSLPNAKPSLPRVTKHLPFPSDLVETLSYSAAYVDQAGYMAKYAMKQFEKLDQSYHLLEKKSEARAAKITKLEGDVTRLTSENQALNKKNADLVKENEKIRKEAAEREAALEERIRAGLEKLRASEGREKKLKQENAKLRKYIDDDCKKDAEREKAWQELFELDRLADAAREQEWQEHDDADHEALRQSQEETKKAQELARQLKEEIVGKNKTIAELKEIIKATECKLEAAEAEVCKLKGDLAMERQEKAEIQAKLEDALHRLSVAEKDLAYLRPQIEILRNELAAEKKCRAQLQADFDAEKHQHKLTKRDLEKYKRRVEDQDETIGNQEKDIARLKRKLQDAKEASESLQTLVDSLTKANKEVKDMVDRANEEAEAAETKLGNLKKKTDKRIKELENQVAELQSCDDNQRISSTAPEPIKTGVTTSVAEITL